MSDDPRPPRQLGLFGPIDPESTTTVLPAPVPAEIAALAARLPAALRLGTSSWSFAGWRGLVYAASVKPNRLAGHGLAAYAQHPLLRAVGVDRTFYAPIDQAAFAAMAAAVPPGFRFLVKAWSDCTTPSRRGGAGANAHYLDPAMANDLVLAPAVQGLGEQLGHLLFQFPPQGSAIVAAPQRFAERVHAFLAALPQRVPAAVELRDAALLTADLVAALRSVGAEPCYSLHPRMPDLAAQLAIAPLAVGQQVLVRWMLHASCDYQTAKDRYEPFARLVDPDPGRRAAIAGLCREALLRRLPVTVVVNNKAEGSAPLSVLELARRIVAGD